MLNLPEKIAPAAKHLQTMVGAWWLRNRCALGLHFSWCGNLLWGISSVQSGFATRYACYRNATRMKMKRVFKSEVW